MFESFTNFGGLFLLFNFTALFGLIYQFILRSWFYFNNRNVKFVRGIPVLGSAYKSVIGFEPAAISYRRLYETFRSEKFIGIYDFGSRPSYLIRDPDLIKQLIINDSEHFNRNKFTVQNENDLFAHILFGVCGIKLNVIPTFPVVSSNEMQSMHEIMVKCSEQYIETLKQIDKIAKMFHSRDLFTRYACDIIAVTAFGVENNNSMHDIDNELLKADYALNEYRYKDGLKFLASLSIPSFVKLFDVCDVEKKDIKVLKESIAEKIKSRKSKSIVRNDFVDFLVKAQNGQNDDVEDKRDDISFATAISTSARKNNAIARNVTDDDLVAQYLAFALGSLSSVSGTACFMFHELALNPDVQDKLFAEIENVKKQLNGSPVTYEKISSMKYLDMVLCETLRRWCSIPFLERTCIRPYILENSNGQVEIQIGDGIFVPTYALHMDESYFAKPLKFDPERFSDDNKSSIQSGTYLPFGISTRNCIGSQFTVLTVKTLAFHLISEFFIDKSYKTEDPLKLKALPLHMDADGFFIELRRRDPDRTPYKSQVFT